MKPSEEQRFAVVAGAQSPALRRAAYVLCGDFHLADDLVQKTLLKLFLTWPLRDEGAAPAWLTRTLVRTFVDETRRPWWWRERLTETLPDSAAASAASLDDALLSQLARLPPRQRACITLRFLEDYSIEQTAEALGCSIGTVKAHTSRGLRQLRQLIASDPHYATEESR